MRVGWGGGVLLLQGGLTEEQLDTDFICTEDGADQTEVIYNEHRNYGIKKITN